MGHTVEIEISDAEFELLKDESLLSGMTVEEQAALHVIMAMRRHNIGRIISGSKSLLVDAGMRVSEEAEKYGHAANNASGVKNEPELETCETAFPSADCEENIQRVMNNYGITKQEIIDHPIYKYFGFFTGPVSDKSEDYYFGSDGIKADGSPLYPHD